MYIVILAGGAGTRFWPLSRKMHPKQLMSVFGGKSMLQRTVERVLPLKPKGILIVTNALQAAETAAQLAYLKDAPIDIIAEPVGRNTAPAIGLAAVLIARDDPGAVMTVLPADHYIADEEGFRSTLLRAREEARWGCLMTLGIKPDRPETGYGYIEADQIPGGAGSYRVRRFVEKPDLEKALAFLAAGNFYWNSGMFVWQAGVILRELERHMPELAAALRRLDLSGASGKAAAFNAQLAAFYSQIKGESIDYGVMEKAVSVQVIPAAFGWSDVGSWRAFPEVIPPDGSGNVLINTRESVNIDARGCVVYGGGKLVALVGVRNLIVVSTDDALMVCAAERAQDVKKVVEELEKRGMTEYL